MGAGRPASGPCEALATQEQYRADGLAARIGEITDHPGHPLTGSLPYFRAAYLDAATRAAAFTAQPVLRP